MQVCIFDSTTTINGLPSLTIALVSFERQRNYVQAASILYDEYKVKLQGIDLLIIRPPVDIPVTNLETECGKAREIVSRFPQLPIHLLYSVDYKIQLSNNINGEARSIIQNTEESGSTRFIQHICQKEMESFILNSFALFRSPAGSVYRTPSQEYTHTFLRAGNIQTSRHVLDAIFFWVLPYLKEAGSVLTDSWSISSIALNISRLLCRYDSQVKIDQFHVNMLTSHHSGIKTLDSETENTIFPLLYETDKKILFLISAVKTLKSLEYLKKAFSTLNIQIKLDYLALYRLISQNSVQYLCDLSGEFSVMNNARFDTYDKPPEGEAVIEIDEKVFFPLKPQETEVSLRQAAAKSASDFFRAYEGKDIFFIHRDAFYLNKDRFRHHGIYIDIIPMLKCDRFIQKIKTATDSFKTLPALIIHPPHEPGIQFTEQICKFLEIRFGVRPPVFQLLDNDLEASPQGKLASEMLSALSYEQTIIIADDVSVTGSRLKNYQKKLRDIYKGHIHYFTGVARPDSETKWQRRVKDLEYRGKAHNGKTLLKHTISCLEKVILPDWDDKRCPWCSEKNKIANIIAKPSNQGYPLTRELKKRYSQLINSPELSGLKNDVFFSVNNLNKPAFQGSSVFCNRRDVSEADLIAIIAAAVQFLRNEGHSENSSDTPVKLESEYPFLRILKPETYLSEDPVYNEAIIKAAIIRTCYRSELYATGDNNYQKQLNGIERFFLGYDLKPEEIPFFIYELFIAIKEKKLPKPDIAIKLIKILEKAYLNKIQPQ